MRDNDAATQAAQAGLEHITRNMFWITGRNLATDTLESAGFWDDIGTYDFTVLDGNTLEEVTRAYTGSGPLITVGDIPLTADMTIRHVKVRLSPLSEQVNTLLRGYDLKAAPVEIHRARMNANTRALVAPPRPRLVGVVDSARIVHPEEAEDGVAYAELDVVTDGRELTRASAEKSSHESQLLRDPTDEFYKDMEQVGEWQQYWGTSSGQLSSVIVYKGGFVRTIVR